MTLLLESRLYLHETGFVWNQFEIDTDKPCVYTRPGRSALDTVKTRIKEPRVFGVRLAKVLKLRSFDRTFRPNVR